MKLETRVEALEHELKILKNEIQVTLLEIQEQILNHYYPELRAEDSAPPAGEAARRAAVAQRAQAESRNGGKQPGGRNASAAVGRNGENGEGVGHRRPTAVKSGPPSPGPMRSPFSDLEMEDLLEDEELDEIWDEAETNGGATYIYGEDEDATADEDGLGYEDDFEDGESVSSPRPRVREVNPAQLRNKGKGKRTGGTAANSTGGNGTGRGAGDTRRVFAALAGWVAETVGEIGKARTQEVVETYAAGGGRLTAESQSALERLLAFSEDSEPSAPVTNKMAMGALIRLDEILSAA